MGIPHDIHDVNYEVVTQSNFHRLKLCMIEIVPTWHYLFVSLGVLAELWRLLRYHNIKFLSLITSLS